MTMQGENTETVLQRLARCVSFEEVREAGFLFHGTCERIEGPLQGGAYDGVFWAAAHPSVAQAYIPASGSTTWLRSFQDGARDEPMRPTQGGGFMMRWALARAGATVEDLDVQWLGYRASSWRNLPGWPSNADLEAWVRSLGYQKDEAGLYTLKLGHDVEGEFLMGAAERLPGRLLILLADQVEIVDAPWSENAQWSAHHRRLGDFATFSRQGLEAFRMQDLLQSDHLGNVGHEAIGILPPGIAKLSWIAIPARRHDGDTLETWSRPETEEFTAFMRALNPDYQTPVAEEPEATQRREELAP